MPRGHEWFPVIVIVLPHGTPCDGQTGRWPIKAVDGPGSSARFGPRHNRCRPHFHWGRAGLTTDGRQCLQTTCKYCRFVTARSDAGRSQQEKSGHRGTIHGGMLLAVHRGDAAVVRFACLVSGNSSRLRHVLTESHGTRTMTQLFSPLADFVFRICLLVAVSSVLFFGVVAWAWWRSPWADGRGIVVDQPVPFSHEHHASELGLDCRYCHRGVEQSAFAGMPTTHTCMTCHSQLWTDAELLLPVRQSLARNEPLRWQRVHHLPDYVFFDHHVHVANGIGCTSCHGKVGQMPLTMKAEPLSMSWCLDCHRDPSARLRAQNRIFDPVWLPDREHPDAKLLARYGIDKPSRLVQCSICHR